MPRKSSTIAHQTSSTNQKHNCRRVSFDLTHNTIHILPTLEECKESARQRGREEWERRQLNEEMLCESIILEIQQANTSHAAEEKELQPPQAQVLKSCLKKSIPTPEPSPRKKHKKGKRSSSNNRSRFPGGCSSMDTWGNFYTLNHRAPNAPFYRM